MQPVFKTRMQLSPFTILFPLPTTSSLSIGSAIFAWKIFLSCIHICSLPLTTSLITAELFFPLSHSCPGTTVASRQLHPDMTLTPFNYWITLQSNDFKSGIPLSFQSKTHIFFSLFIYLFFKNPEYI